ncbi:hypothetical protein GOBAR_AA18322 [Gossypium barbadense]|uniref:Uncharacterized protein n=1 Tax=Gossypium barbadense TaxID=3634 RepID=A0A2P5XG64_GOSBA|nr:hypothetical protein GOBAR_AA18322 [Gossypium barbadense]
MLNILVNNGGLRNAGRARVDWAERVNEQCIDRKTRLLLYAQRPINVDPVCAVKIAAKYVGFEDLSKGFSDIGSAFFTGETGSLKSWCTEFHPDRRLWRLAVMIPNKNE